MVRWLAIGFVCCIGFTGCITSKARIPKRVTDQIRILHKNTTNLGERYKKVLSGELVLSPSQKEREIRLIDANTILSEKVLEYSEVNTIKE